VEKQLLWEEMPPFRRAVWLLGLLWAVLAVLGRSAAVPHGDFRSRWRPSRVGYLVRSLLVASLLLLALLVTPVGARLLKRWTMYDLVEAGAFCLVLGAFLVWLSSWHLLRRPVSVRVETGILTAYAVCGPGRKRRELDVSDLRHLQLDATDVPERPWRISAVSRDGRTVPLLDYRDEIEARRALRSLGTGVGRAIAARVEGVETVIPAEAIGLSLRARLGGLPAPELPPRPKGLDLVTESAEGRWTLRYPRVERRVRWLLLGLALLPAVLFALTCWMLDVHSLLRLAWLAWILAGGLLAMVVYVLIALKEEVVARLGEARLELTNGELRFHRPDGRVEEVRLDSIENVELGRRGATPTIAVISPDRIIHVAGLATEEERSWVRATVEAAILKAERVRSEV